MSPVPWVLAKGSRRFFQETAAAEVSSAKLQPVRRGPGQVPTASTLYTVYSQAEHSPDTNQCLQLRCLPPMGPLAFGKLPATSQG